jgi:hypothetical protein
MENNLDLAEKYRRAKLKADEEERAAKQAKRDARKENVKDFFGGIGDFFGSIVEGIIDHGVVFLYLLLGIVILIPAATIVLEIVGLVFIQLTKMLQIVFWISLAVIVASIAGAIIIYSNGDDGIYLVGTWYLALSAITLVVLCFTTLGMSRMWMKNVYTDEEYGVIYVELDDSFYAEKVESGHETVLIRSKYEGKVVSLVSQDAAKNNGDIVTLIFEGGDIEIQKSAFNTCSRLSSITFGGDYTYKIGEDAFANCKNMTDIDVGAATITNAASNVQYNLLGASVTNLKVDGGNISHTTINVETLTLGKGSDVQFESGSISKAVFEDGYTFTDHNVSRFVTHGIYNITYTYYNFATNIYLPTSVTSIPDNFFGDDGGITTVYFAGTEEQWNAVTIGASGNSNYSSDKVRVVYNTTYNK